MDLRTLICCTSSFIAPFFPLSAQEKSETGYTLEWRHELVEQADVLSVEGRQLQGWSFMAYECSTGEALGYWKDHMEKLDGRVKGNEPTRATEVNVPGLGTSVPVIFADVRKDRDGGGVRITVVFALNDSTAAPVSPGMTAAVHEMSVAVNRAVVQAQLTEQEKVLSKTSGHLEDAQNDRRKATNKADHASADLKKIQARKEKLLRKQAGLQHDVEGLQKRYDATQDPRTLEKMARTHQKLADVEQDMAREQQRETDALAQAGTEKDKVPDARADQHTQAEENDRASKEQEALKNKLEAIR